MCHWSGRGHLFFYWCSNIYYINDNLDKRTWTYIFGACCATTVFIPSFHNYRMWSFLGLIMTTYAAWYLTIASLLHGQVHPLINFLALILALVSARIPHALDLILRHLYHLFFMPHVSLRDLKNTTFVFFYDLELEFETLSWVFRKTIIKSLFSHIYVSDSGVFTRPFLLEHINRSWLSFWFIYGLIGRWKGLSIQDQQRWCYTSQGLQTFSIHSGDMLLLCKTKSQIKNIVLFTFYLQTCPCSPYLIL